jgi:hypothetical protein
MGYEPIALLRLNISQFLALVSGYRERKATDENHFRRLYYLLYSIHRDPKKAVIPADQLWPIPDIDYVPEYDEGQDYERTKAELMKLWGVSEN